MHQCFGYWIEAEFAELARAGEFALQRLRASDEKARMKAERRAQKKLEGPSADDVTLMEPLTGPLLDPEGLFSDPDSDN